MAHHGIPIALHTLHRRVSSSSKANTAPCSSDVYVGATGTMVVCEHNTAVGTPAVITQTAIRHNTLGFEGNVGALGLVWPKRGTVAWCTHGNVHVLCLTHV